MESRSRIGGRMGLGPRDAESDRRMAWPGSIRSRVTVYSWCTSYGILDVWDVPYGMERGSAISWPEPGRSCEWRGEYGEVDSIASWR